VKPTASNPTPTHCLLLPSGRVVGSDRGSVSIGRDPSCDVVVDDDSLSPHHASVERHPQGWLLADQESAQGTFVDGERVTQALLKAGQELRVGSARLRVDPLPGAGSSTPGQLALVLLDAARTKASADEAGADAAPPMSEADAAARLGIWPGANAEEILHLYERKRQELLEQMSRAASAADSAGSERELQEVRAACSLLVRRGSK
jgi:pSer/pThr/pTyr-binding forkhead associated (FHA) protein